MFDKIYELFKKNARLKFIITIIVLFLIFNIAILPYVGKRISSQGGIGPIDLQLFYSSEKVYSMIESYGNEIRLFYAIFELTGDIIYPFITFLMMVSITTILIKKVFINDKAIKFITVVPIVTLLSDYLENVSIVTMIFNYPDKLLFIPNLTCILTVTKWSFFVVNLIIIFFLSIIFIIKKIRNNK